MTTGVIAFIRAHLGEIIENSAMQIKKEGIQPYASLDLAQVGAAIRRSIELDLDYLETGDITAWREYHVGAVKRMTQSGGDLRMIVRIGLIISTVYETFVTTEVVALGTIDGLPATKVAADLVRRLKNLTTAAVFVTTTSNLQQVME